MKAGLAMIGGLLCASPAMAQLAVPDDGLEILSSAHGSSTRQAEAFIVYSSLTNAVEQQHDAVRRQFMEGTMEWRQPCNLNGGGLGFIGNPASLESEIDAVAAAEAAATTANPGWWPSPLRAVFPNREAAEKAASVVVASGGYVIQSGPVLFDCEDAQATARANAVRDALPEAEAVAASLGLRIREVLRVDFSIPPNSFTVYAPVETTEGNPDEVVTTVPITLTYKAYLREPVF